MKTRRRAAMNRGLQELKPSRLLEWEHENGGRAVLLVPRFRGLLLGRLLLVKLRQQSCYRVNLDEVGTYVWEQCDGEKTVAQIAESMQSTFGDQVEPVHHRLCLFLNQLMAGHYIRFK